MKVKAYAKINLYLDVEGKRPDGYHNVATIMQEITLADELIIKLCRQGIKIGCNKEEVPVDERNTVYKAVKVLKDYIARHKLSTRKFAGKRGVQIKIIKNIPAGGGLGGGSSDAATTLVTLNKLWGLGLSVRKLEELGAKIGADVPFFIKGGAAYGGGRGDVLKPLKPLAPLGVILVNPGYPVSTKWVYENLKIGLTNKKNNNIIKKYAHIQQLKKGQSGSNGIKKVTVQHLKTFLYNALTPTVIKRYPAIAKIQDTLGTRGIKSNLMSGSGATVFGLLATKKLAQKTKEVLRQPETYWVWAGMTRNR
ncbi:MAG: 4-(cytidine 5'-diphospho)-2-C-methyl-D-erythritol kinase [bacterium]